MRMKIFSKTEERRDTEDELEAVRRAVEAARLPEAVDRTAREELEKLGRTNPGAVEYAIGLTYLDYLIELPWRAHSEDNLDLARAEAILDEAHFGLEEVKERLLEYLAVRILRSRRRPRVLVADDEQIARNNLSHILKKEGYDTYTAADGEGALALLDSNEFDVVLTDMRMGRINGIQVLEEVKSRSPETEVVMVTGYATVDSAVEAMKKGAYHYLTKPFKNEDVRATMKEILGKKDQTRATRGPVLCFVGPPGTGKTSLGRSIARALGRKFIRLSLAGLKDEAEIRGHRRTYAGALPGRIIQEIRRVGVNNPVFMLDEIDKAIMGFKSDPTSALLEVLDPEQNAQFTDYYLDIPFDLSGIIFIATANVTDPLPPALLDRMEVIDLEGYSEAEKVHIASRFIVPRQIEETGLQDCAPEFTPEAIAKIIREHTREAGLRNLDREIGRLCRRLAREVVANGSGGGPVRITPEAVQTYLGPRRYIQEVAQAEDRIGVTTGIFLTENGGEIVFVEATMMKGDSQLILTGSLGEVMQESARAGLSYLRANAAQFGLDEDFFLENDIHVHVPAGAVPKDGPSAGLTIAVALLSLLTRRPARRDLALTGELTLSGRLLPVGGVKEKILAARRAGVKTVILPGKNRPDYERLAQESREGMTVIFVDSLLEVTDLALWPVTGPDG
jgi:ATP-dependent Lon protease